MKFKIKAMTNKDFDEIRKKSMEVKKNRRIEMDMQKFNSAIVINHTVVPDFKDSESIKKTGSLNPEEYMNKVLLAGEIAELVAQIQSVITSYSIHYTKLYERSNFAPVSERS